MAAKAESRMMIAVMDATTARVVALPTAAEEFPAFMPYIQPLMAMMMPKNTLLKTPRNALSKLTTVRISFQ